jgi:hypothetical protein
MSGTDMCFFALGMLGVYLLLEIMLTVRNIDKDRRKYYARRSGSKRS